MTENRADRKAQAVLAWNQLGITFETLGQRIEEMRRLGADMTAVDVAWHKLQSDAIKTELDVRKQIGELYAAANESMSALTARLEEADS